MEDDGATHVSGNINGLSFSDVDGLQLGVECFRLWRHTSCAHPRRKSLEIRYHPLQQVGSHRFFFV